MKLTEKEESTIQRVLVYGPPGSGKTELVGALAEKKKLLWFDLDGGYTTLLKLPTEWKERIDVISIPDSKVFPVAIETILKVVKGGAHKICHEHGKVGCPLCTKEGKPVSVVELNKLDQDTVVVFDPLSQLTMSALAHITKNQLDEYKMQTDDWGSLSKLMGIFLSQVQNSPFHVVCISHDVDTEKDEKAPERLAPLVGSRNTAKNAAGYFADVIRAELKNKRHTFSSSSTAGMNFLSKSRSGFMIESLPTPSLLPLFCPELRTPEMFEKRGPSAAATATAALQTSLRKITLAGSK